MPPTKKTPADHAEPRPYGLRRSRLEDLDLPSGGLVQVRRPGLQGLVAAGIVDDLDTLTGIVASETVPQAEGKEPPAAAQPSTEQVVRALEVMDRIVGHVVVQPALLPTPDGDEPRDDDAWYVDDVDLEDKAFIVSYAMGGTRDLETFRAQSAAAVGGVAARAGVP